MTKEEHAKVLAYLESLRTGVAVWKLGASWGLDECIAIMHKEPPRWSPEELADAQKRADAYSDWFVSGGAAIGGATP